MHQVTKVGVITTDCLNNNKNIPTVNVFFYIHFEITGYPCNLICSQLRDLFTNQTIFLLEIFFSANENGTVKQNNQSDFKVSLKMISSPYCAVSAP